MRLTVRCQLEREHFVWACAYILSYGYAKRPTRAGILKFLREQCAMFGGDMTSLAGGNYEIDFETELTAAGNIVDRLFTKEEMEA